MNPFAGGSEPCLAGCTEADLLGRIRRWLGAACPPPPHGIGDDAAIIPANRRSLVLTTDPVIHGRHFDASVTPAQAAAKLLRRNLSDLAAMGARPEAALVSLAAPPQLRLDWLEGFYRALGRECRRWAVDLVGGDLSGTDGFLGAFLTLTGRPAGRRLLTRSGAREGDWIYVTGDLGGSLGGHHLSFKPRLEEGAWLAARRSVHAMLDVSDGLGKDLPALLPAACRAVVDASALPVALAAHRQAARDRRSPLDHAVNDGEDYELLFAVAPGAAARRLESAWAKAFTTRLSRIGRIEAAGRSDPRIVIAGETDGLESALHGYDHFG
ncbi:MAG: thiamine-phosphate kinase [Puniceicoccaceae bacterium]|nr:MAG: thiamine-phosphate kinase [Puniceicoccaceae bacterium]